MTAATHPSGQNGLERALRLGPVVLFLAVIVALPLLLQPFWVGRVTGWIPLAVAALGLNLLTGYNGQISLGHGAFYALGAYTAAILITEWQWPLLLAAAAAGALAFVLGVVIGIPALRIKGFYLALVTLAFATLFPDLIRQAEGLTGGTGGYRATTEVENSRGAVVDRPVELHAPEWTGLADDQWNFYVYAFAAVVLFWAVRNLVHSRAGRSIVAIRDNAVAAEVNGVHVARTKVFTFGASAALAGLGGAMLAILGRQLSPSSFVVTLSIFILIAVVIGGPASILGPALGAIVIGFFEDVVSGEWLPEDLQAATPLILGIALILQVLIAPTGIVGQFRDIRDHILHRQGADSAGAADDAEGETSEE